MEFLANKLDAGVPINVIDMYNPDRGGPKGYEMRIPLTGVGLVYAKLQYSDQMNLVVGRSFKL